MLKMEAPHRFIVIDDDPINNLVCEINIARFNSLAEIKIFSEPEIALLAIEEMYRHTLQNIPAVLFLDINMPTMTGWEFLEEYQKFSPQVHNQITIYMLSSSMETVDKEKAEKNPFVKGFFSKPLSLDALKQYLS